MDGSKKESSTGRAGSWVRRTPSPGCHILQNGLIYVLRNYSDMCRGYIQQRQKFISNGTADEETNLFVTKELVKELGDKPLDFVANLSNSVDILTMWVVKIPVPNLNLGVQL